MDVGDVKAVVGDTPHMTIAEARAMTDFMQENRVHDVLELGFQHGVSTCYMASALRNSGKGHITTVDLYKPERAGRERIETFLDTLHLRDLVTIHYEPTSYNWRLMKMLEESPEPRFDMCYLDGAHTWEVDGLAFFLVDRLLRPGGWLVFDDLNWSYATSPALHAADWVLELPEDERTTPQVRRVYELLVKTHSGYDSFRTDREWAFARKRPQVSSAPVEVVREVVVQRERVGLGGAALDIAERLQRKATHTRRSRSPRT